MTNTYPSLLHQFWTTDVWAASATSESSQFVSSRACPLLMDYFWNVCSKWKILFIYLLFLKRCTRNTVWALTSYSRVPSLPGHCFPRLHRKRRWGCQCPACTAKLFFLPWRPSQAWQENRSRLSRMILQPQTKTSTGWGITALPQRSWALDPSDNFILFISW